MMMADAANPSHAMALVLVDEFVRNGVTDAVVAPGSRSAALAMALHDDARIRLHVQVDERSAGFLAIGLARSTGRPAIVVTTSGGATANLHPSVVEADTGCVPLIVLTADRPPELQSTGANQTIDQAGLYGTSVRWAGDPGVAEDQPGSVALWRSTVCHAVAASQGIHGAAGPVHLNLPFREPTVPATDDGRTAAAGPFTQPLDGRPDGAPWVSVDRSPRVADDVHIQALADRLAAVVRGVIVVGDTTAKPASVHALAAALNWPVIAEPHAGARHGDHVVAHAGPLLAVPGFRDAHRPDLVLRFGRPTVARSVLGLLDAGVHVAVDASGAWHDPTRSTAHLLVADPTRTCDALAAAITGRSTATDPGWRQAWRDADHRAAAAVTRILDGVDGASEPGTLRAALAAVPAGGNLVVASSMPIRDLDAWAPARGDVRIVSNRGASGIDGFVSTALGVALGSGAPTVAVAGDLSLLHDANGFLLRSDGPASAVFVVIDNDGGGIFHFLPQADHPGSFERVFGTPHGVDLAALGRLHGLDVVQPAAGQIVQAVAGRARAGGLHLVHVRTDRQANRALHTDLQDAVARAVSG
jgi:2-succinyl-5-enolpyruvyl-6-hydroxy-3-cyclohexene-1-carboxylate synthase